MLETLKKKFKKKKVDHVLVNGMKEKLTQELAAFTLELNDMDEEDKHDVPKGLVKWILFKIIKINKSEDFIVETASDFHTGLDKIVAYDYDWYPP